MSANGAVGFWNTKELSQTYANNNRDFFRPTTDKVLQLAEELVDRSTAKNILDLASGTGNPAIRLALAFPDCHVHATGERIYMVGATSRPVGETCIRVLQTSRLRC